MLIQLWAFLFLPVMTACRAITAYREDPSRRKLVLRNVSVGFMAFSILVSGGYTLGKELALRDARDHVAGKP